jgi:hypothetical protein
MCFKRLLSDEGKNSVVDKLAFCPSRHGLGLSSDNPSVLLEWFFLVDPQETS